MRNYLFKCAFMLFAISLMSFTLIKDSKTNKVNTENQSEIVTSLTCPGEWSNWYQIENCRQGVPNQMKFARHRSIYVCKTGAFFEMEYEYYTTPCFY